MGGMTGRPRTWEMGADPGGAFRAIVGPCCLPPQGFSGFWCAVVQKAQSDPLRPASVLQSGRSVSLFEVSFEVYEVVPNAVQMHAAFRNTVCDESIALQDANGSAILRSDNRLDSPQP